jgi:predicted RNA-binding Zn-ribbon protein involved in translation (DUF1610 family)
MQEYTVHYQLLVDDQLIEDTLVVEAFSEQRAVETVLKRLDEHYYVAILLECQTVSEERCCPCCLEGYMERSTMSRLDNQTEICPTCGILEALAMQ